MTGLKSQLVGVWVHSTKVALKAVGIHGRGKVTQARHGSRRRELESTFSTPNMEVDGDLRSGKV